MICREKDSNGIKPIVEIGAKAIGGLFSSLIDEQLASAERDIAEIISQQKLGAKAQSRRRDFTANIERKRSDAREVSMAAKLLRLREVEPTVLTASRCFLPMNFLLYAGTRLSIFV